MELSEWLREKYLEWQKELGKLRSVSSFARYLGISQQALNSYMNGSYLPKRENLAKIAGKLGYEVYEILGMGFMIKPPKKTEEEIWKMAEALQIFPPGFQVTVARAIIETSEQVPKEVIKGLDEDTVLLMLVKNIQKRSESSL